MNPLEAVWHFKRKFHGVSSARHTSSPKWISVTIADINDTVEFMFDYNNTAARSAFMELLRTIYEDPFTWTVTTKNG